MKISPDPAVVFCGELRQAISHMVASSRIGNPPAPLWLWPNLLGLDAPLVAICWQWLFSHSFGLDLAWSTHLILGLSVWCIYLADRLYDSLRTSHASEGTERLAFTSRNRKKLIALLFTAGIANILLICTYLDEEILRNGFLLSLFVGMYYAMRISARLSRALLVPREIFCGFIFAAGTVLSTWTGLTEEQVSPVFFPTVGCFGLLCAVNCLLISFWEKKSDRAVSDRSAATSKSLLGKTILTLFLILISVSGFLGFRYGWAIPSALVLSGSGLGLLILRQKKLSPRVLRVCADGVLLSPLILLCAKTLLP